MGNPFQAVEIAENIYWVGAIDWDVRDFHGYLTSRGTSYNAFLVLADKVTLIDTVKAPFLDEMMARIGSVVEPSRIDYIVSNHSEMDHSGCLPQTVAAVVPEKVFASKMGQKALDAHFRTGGDITAVADGDTLDLGNMTLSFVETRMCHWPDSMVTYLHEADVLFSQDAFGMHLASGERFADELPRDILDREAARYYANILLPLSSFVAKTLEKVSDLGLTPSVVAPDHGPAWRTPDDIQRIIGSYARWAAQKPGNKAVVVYDTMWQSTAAMARAAGEGLAAGGTTVRLMSMRSCHRSDVATELLDAGGLLVGSPTINNGIFPTLADVMTYLKGLKPRNRVGATFGSYGWSGEAPGHLQMILQDMEVEIVAEPLRTVYVPDEASLLACRRLGEAVARRLGEVCNERHEP